MSDSVAGAGAPPSRLRTIVRGLLPFAAFLAYIGLELPVLIASGVVTGTTDPVRFLLIPHQN
jgi:hypothetical protein